MDSMGRAAGGPSGGSRSSQAMQPEPWEAAVVPAQAEGSSPGPGALGQAGEGVVEIPVQVGLGALGLLCAPRRRQGLGADGLRQRLPSGSSRAAGNTAVCTWVQSSFIRASREEQVMDDRLRHQGKEMLIVPCGVGELVEGRPWRLCSDSM